MLIKRVKDFCIQKTMLKSLKNFVAVNGTEWKYLAWTKPEIDREPEVREYTSRASQS
jgi:hypothetical protein